MTGAERATRHGAAGTALTTMGQNVVPPSTHTKNGVISGHEEIGKCHADAARRRGGLGTGSTAHISAAGGNAGHATVSDSRRDGARGWNRHYSQNPDLWKRAWRVG